LFHKGTFEVPCEKPVSCAEAYVAANEELVGEAVKPFRKEVVISFSLQQRVGK
jgi:hypothetical protein